VGGINRRIRVQASLGRYMKLDMKNKAKKTKGEAQVVELLPSNCKALSINPRTTIIDK
jgi:hypothetical protein